MDKEQPALEPLSKFLCPIFGLPAWSVKQGHGSFMTFEFGKPKLKLREWQSKEGDLCRSAHVYGRWRLWIYCCNWRALSDGEQIAWSEDEPKLIGRAASALNGQKLLSVDVMAKEGRSRIKFDLGGSLETWSYGDDASEEQWLIMSPTETLFFKADGSHEIAPCAE